MECHIAPQDDQSMHAVAPSTLITDYHRRSIYQEALAIWRLSYETRGNHLAVEALVEGERINGYPGALE